MYSPRPRSTYAVVASQATVGTVTTSAAAAQGEA